MTATLKQVNFILKNTEMKEEEIQKLTIKEASIMISKIIKGLKEGKKTTKKEDPKNEIVDLKSIDWDSLYKKYNAYSVDTTSSNYNDINGVNKNSDLLKDSRKFKSFISNVIKTEFKGIKYKISCSFKSYRDYCDIQLFIEDPFLNYTEAVKKSYSNYNNIYSLVNNSCLNIASNKQLTRNHYKYIYNNYFKIIGITEERYSYRMGMKHFLKDEVNKLYDFLKALLNSYSYDHSDIMTDYFSSGLEGGISIYDCKYTEEERKESYNKVNNITYNQMEVLGAETEEEKEEIKKHHEAETERINREIEEERKNREEMQKLIDAKNAEIQKLIDDKESYESKELEDDELIIEKTRFSSWNKPSNIDEAIEFINDHPEKLINGTVAFIQKIVNIKNEKLYNIITNNLLKDWDFLKNKKYGGCGWLRKNNNKYEEVSKEIEKDLYYQRLTEADGYYYGRNAVLIQLNGKNKFLVDPSGHSYCRYVGLLD